MPGSNANPGGSGPPDGRKGPASALDDYERLVAMYTLAGGEETVQRVVTAISRIERGFDLYYRQHAARLQLSYGEWTVLSVLALEGQHGHLTPTRLADHAAVSPSTMTHRLDRMGERGLVTRVVDQANRTRVQVFLTDAGWRLFRRSVVEADAIEARVLQRLTHRQRRQLATLLEQVVAELPDATNLRRES